MEGPPPSGADATPVQAVAKVPRRRKHSGASPLLVAAVPVPHDSPPPVPVFVARDPSLPPPERQPRAAPDPRYKRKAGVHRGSDVLATSERCAIQCPHACCVNGGFSDALATTWRQQLRDASAKGTAFRRAYLLALMGRQQHSGKLSGQFRSRPHVAGPAGSCAWCSTVRGPLDRSHRYNAKCPRYQEGQQWLNGKITKRHEYFVPALSPGTPRVQVSRKYWTRLFDVYHKQLKTLQSVTATPDPVAALVSDTGRHDHHHEICQELKDTIESVVVKFLAAAEDHYVPQERVASRWLNLGEGVTWRIVWEQVLAEYQPAFGVQSKQLGGYLWGFHNKKRRPNAAKYAALGGRVRAAISYTHCTAYIQRTWRVRLKPNEVDQCEACATMEHKKA